MNKERIIERLKDTIHRRERAIAFLRSAEIREVIAKFDGKVINKKFYDALDAASMSLGKSERRDFDGNGTGEFYSDIRVCRTLKYDSDELEFYDNRVSYRDDGLGMMFIVPRDYSRNEKIVQTGKRLDAKALIALFDLHAERSDKVVSDCRSSIANLDAIVSRIERAAAEWNSALDAATWDIREFVTEQKIFL